MSFFHSSTCSSDAFSWSQQRHGRELRRRKEQEIEEQKNCEITSMQRPCQTMRPKGHMLDFFQLVKYIRIYIHCIYRPEKDQHVPYKGTISKRKDPLSTIIFQRRESLVFGGVVTMTSERIKAANCLLKFESCDA